MIKIIILSVHYKNDTMLHSLYLKTIRLEKSSNNTSQDFLVAIISHWYIPPRHHNYKLCSLWVNLITKINPQALLAYIILIGM